MLCVRKNLQMCRKRVDSEEVAPVLYSGSMEGWNDVSVCLVVGELNMKTHGARLTSDGAHLTGKDCFLCYR